MPSYKTLETKKIANSTKYKNKSSVEWEREKIGWNKTIEAIFISGKEAPDFETHCIGTI